MMPARFHMDAMTPPDCTGWQLALEQYETSGDLMADALDWISTAPLTDDQENTVAQWYRDSDDCVTAVEDRMDGER